MYRIAMLAGDGIGSEIMPEAERALKAVADAFGFGVKLSRALIGGAAIDATGEPLPEDTVKLCKDSDATLLGAVGGPKWDALPPHLRAERGILGIRKELGLFANLRPVKLYSALKDASPLKPELCEGMDILIVRELTGGIYFGERGRIDKDGEQAAFDTEIYSVSEVRRIAKLAFELARLRSNRVCSIDKANVLESSRLWRETVVESAKGYDAELSHMYVDNAAMQLVRNPRQFDVMLTNNIFGDILSDEASQLTGSIGMLPSASLGEEYALYEPIHGSAPEIAGSGRANPIAMILSVAMMLRYTLKQAQAADCIEKAVESALEGGARTPDIAKSSQEAISTEEMGAFVLQHLSRVVK